MNVIEAILNQALEPFNGEALLKRTSVAPYSYVIAHECNDAMAYVTIPILDEDRIAISWDLRSTRPWEKNYVRYDVSLADPRAVEQIGKLAARALTYQSISSKCKCGGMQQVADWLLKMV